MKNTLLETQPLSNGTTLRLVDASRPQIGDRWIVILEARIEIPISEGCVRPEETDGLSLETLQKVLGRSVTYTSRKERIFVPVTEKDRLLQTFLDDFRRDMLPYLSHPAFPPRYILKQYREIEKRQSWAKAETLWPGETPKQS